MNRIQIVTEITNTLISSESFQKSGQDIRALVTTAGDIADLILDNQDAYERNIVTEDDEEMIEEIEKNKNNVPSTIPSQYTSTFIDDEDLPF